MKVFSLTTKRERRCEKINVTITFTSSYLSSWHSIPYFHYENSNLNQLRPGTMLYSTSISRLDHA